MEAAVARLAVVVWLAGCSIGAPPCEDLERPSEARDRCFGDRALGAARAADVPAATAALQQVDDPLLRAAAVDRVLTDGKGLGTTDAVALCKLLASPFDRSCADTWSRPHLWSGGGRPGTPPGPGRP